MTCKFGSALAVLMLLATSAPAAAEDKKTAAQRKRDPDAIRCVRMPVTGSLARSERVCMSNRDWDQQRENARSMQSLVCSNQTQCAGR